MKIIKYIIALVFIALLTVFSYYLYEKIKKKTEIENNIEKLQPFSFTNVLNNNFISNNNLNHNLFSIFIIFNSDCEHCQYEALEISKNKETFKNSQIIFISFEEIHVIKKFAEKYNINKSNNIYVLKANADEVEKLFGDITIPSLLIYDKSDNLVKKYKGETKLEAITKYL